jgi:hypothetical protein
MPSLGLFDWIIDSLASRYGWTKDYIENSLYWEELWSLVTVAANFTAEERNAEFKFHFMLHADKDSASKWKDLAIPFPVGKEETMKDVLKDNTGVRQLQAFAPHIQIGHVSEDKALEVTKVKKKT